jgi:hypothetical protein
MDSVSVIKRGETCIETVFHRSFEGLVVDVKVHPGVEAFFRHQAHGETTPVIVSGRHWATASDKPFLAYAYQPLELLRSDDGHYITLEKLGQSLIINKERDESYVNLSFLRLVGASEGAGVRFTIAGVYSDKFLRQQRDWIGAAQKKFYIEYLRPIDLRVTISTAEMVV